MYPPPKFHWRSLKRTSQRGGRCTWGPNSMRSLGEFTLRPVASSPSRRSGALHYILSFINALRVGRCTRGLSFKRGGRAHFLFRSPRSSSRTSKPSRIHLVVLQRSDRSSIGKQFATICRPIGPCKGWYKSKGNNRNPELSGAAERNRVWLSRMGGGYVKRESFQVVDQYAHLNKSDNGKNTFM